MARGWLLMISLMAVAAVTLVIAPVVIQERNPLAVLVGVLRLELTDADIVPLPETRLLQRAGPEAPLSRHLSESGWTFEDRLGAGIFYGRDDDQLFVEARMLTRRYVVYELHHTMPEEVLRGLSPRGNRAQIARGLALAVLTAAALAVVYVRARRPGT